MSFLSTIPEVSFVKMNDDTKINIVQFAVDLSGLHQEKFYTLTEKGDLLLWTYGENERWEGHKLDIKIGDGVFVVNKDFFVGKTYENVALKTKEHVLLRYKVNDNVSERIVTFDDNITAIAISLDGSLLVVGTENNKVYILSKTETTYKICNEFSVNGIPISLSIDPNNKLVAAATTEGLTRVYKLNETCDYTMGVYLVVPVTPFTIVKSPKLRRFIPLWYPDGGKMISPTDEGICIFCTTHGNNIFTYNCTTKFDKVAISPNGLYLAGISDEGSALYVFSMEKERLISKTLLPNDISAFVFDLIFCPRNNDVIILAIENSPLVMVFNACQIKEEPSLPFIYVSSDESDNDSYDSDGMPIQPEGYQTLQQSIIAAQSERISSLQEQVNEYADEIASLTCSLLKATGKFSIVGVLQTYADKKEFDLNSLPDWVTIFNKDEKIIALKKTLQCDLLSIHFTDALTGILKKPAAQQSIPYSRMLTSTPVLTMPIPSLMYR